MPVVNATGARATAHVGTALLRVTDAGLELDAFSATPGVDAGAIVPAGIVPADGVRAFCLGHDTPGFFAFFRPGDYVEVTQSGSFSKPLVLFQARTRAPTTPPPAGYAWVASLLFDGVEVARRTLALRGPVDWEWTLNTLDVNHNPLEGNHLLSFRLTLTGPALSPPALPVLELEVPAFYVDNLVFLDHFAPTWPVSPYFTNEVPVDGQGETWAAPAVGANSPPPLSSTSIDFDIYGLGDNIDPATVLVRINGTDAIAGGVVQTGFTGTVGAAGEVLHVHVTRNTVFASAATITVTSQADIVGGGSPNTRTWTFDVQDSTPPTIALAVALAPKQVRVTWSKPITLADPTALHDGLNPALYSIVAIQPDPTVPALRGANDPASLPSVESVVLVDESAPTGLVDLMLSVEVTPGIDYRITAAGVEDLVGNVVTSTQAVMTGFVLPWPQGRVFDLWRLLPRMNRVEDVTQDLLRFIRCLQEPANLLLYDVDNWTDILDVDRAPEAMLDAMLEDLGNPFPFVLTAIQKRRLIRVLPAIFQLKGTDPGIVNVVRFFLGITVDVTTFTGDTMQLGVSVLGGDSLPPRSDPTRLGTWILGPANSYALYSFRVVSPVALTTDELAQVRFIANYMKPAHTHLIEVVLPGTSDVYDPTELGISELGVDWLLHL